MKARVEINATDLTSSKVVAIDREVVVTVDLTEQIAGKKALKDHHRHRRAPAAEAGGRGEKVAGVAEVHA